MFAQFIAVCSSAKTQHEIKEINLSNNPAQRDELLMGQSGNAGCLNQRQEAHNARVSMVEGVVFGSLVALQ